jgi:transcriptional regulator with XRE-family HTH domain
MEHEPDPEHGGEYLRQLRVRAGMTRDEVATRAGVDVGWLAEVEQHGTEDLMYSQIVTVVRATQPPRPEWWDEGHEHDLLVGPNGHAPPRSDGERRYWQRIETVRSAIRRQYRYGRAAST